MADAFELSQLLTHSQSCEDERVAFASQMSFLGCDDALDVIDGVLVEIATACNAQAAASMFAQDAEIAEKEAIETDALRRITVGDAALAREIEEAEMKKGALARLDRELAQQITQMPNRQWQEAGEEMGHSEAEFASRIARDIAAAEHEISIAKQGHLANQLGTEFSDSALSQQAAFELIDARKASKTSGKAIAKTASESAGSSALSASAIPFTPFAAVEHSASELLASAVSFAPAAEQPLVDCTATLTTADSGRPDQPIDCMICFDCHELAELIFPMVQRQPQVGDMVLARYRPTSQNWRSAIVLRTSPAEAKQPWVAVTFEGFADEVTIPSD
eukprot:2091072-Prymnesium_polylepis.1